MGVGIQPGRLAARDSLSLLPPLFALTAALTVLVDAPTPLRAAVVLPFLAFVPGWTLIALVDLRDGVARVTLAVATSLALATLAAGLALYTGLWSPDAILGLLVAWTLIGTAVRYRLRARRPAPTAGAAAVPVHAAPPASAAPPGAGSPPDRVSDAPTAAAPALRAVRERQRRRPFPTDLTDDEWRAVAPLLPPARRHHQYDPRELCDAILYARTVGYRWRTLPSDFPPQRKVRRFHRTLRNNGTWATIETMLDARRAGNPPPDDSARRPRSRA